MFESYDDLNDMQIDVLREIGNIGAGNAATALATILDEKVDISLPAIKIAEFNEVLKDLGGAEALRVAVLVNFKGDANGMIMFLLNMEGAKSIMNILVQEDESEDKSENNGKEGLSEMKLSAIKEIGNILSSSYVNAIAELMGLEIQVSVPAVSIDMVGALMSVPIIEFGAIGDKLMFIEENFFGKSNALTSNIVMFAEIETLKVFMKKLGLEI